MLYIQQNAIGAVLFFENHKTQTEKPPISIIKLLCLEMLTTYEARNQITKQRFKLNTLIPIYINSSVLLMPTGSPRNYETVWINYLKIASFQKYGTKTVVLFTNLDEIEVDISYTRFKEKMKSCKIIYDYMDKVQTQIF
jgi:competence transcription factor ComK